MEWLWHHAVGIMQLEFGFKNCVRAIFAFKLLSENFINLKLYFPVIYYTFYAGLPWIHRSKIQKTLNRQNFNKY
jgi:hypothetical protein